MEHGHEPYTQGISPDDGIPSTHPNVHGFRFDGYECGASGVSSDYFVTWTDEGPAGDRAHQLLYSGGGEDTLDGGAGDEPDGDDAGARVLDTYDMMSVLKINI